MIGSLCQLPQCLCIHLQRLTWSSEGTPIKRQEHVQFAEYLSMDHYKHNTSTQRSQRLRCTAKSIKAESRDDSVEKPSANGSGMLEFLHLQYYYYYYYSVYQIHAFIVFRVSDSEHHNNNKPFSNGTCSSVLLHTSGVNPQLSLAYDYR